ncbi:MAG: hypothetical protein IVW55_12255 [Chloroflexi bacterium]|nr:hypothetical protein [Chloroflexota bacterium]
MKRFSQTQAAQYTGGEWVNKAALVGHITVITGVTLQPATFPDPNKGRTQEAVFSLKLGEDIIAEGFQDAPMRYVSSSAARNVRIAENAKAGDWPCLVEWVQSPPTGNLPHGVITIADPSPSNAGLCARLERMIEGGMVTN